MADVYVNALTTISNEPTSTDSVVCVNRNTNEGQIIDYELLADKILNKLTSKTFSSLTTTSKLLTGAINELDSDVTTLNNKTDAYVIAQETDWYTLSASDGGHLPINNTPPTGYTFVCHTGVIASGFVAAHIFSNGNNNCTIWFQGSPTGQFKVISLFRRT